MEIVDTLYYCYSLKSWNIKEGLRKVSYNLYNNEISGGAKILSDIRQTLKPYCLECSKEVQSDCIHFLNNKMFLIIEVALNSLCDVIVKFYFCSSVSTAWFEIWLLENIMIINHQALMCLPALETYNFIL